MDADLLRLILLALGVILVVGIYLWDRYKKIVRYMHPDPRRPHHMEPTLEGGGDTDPLVAEEQLEPETKEPADTDDLPPGEFVGEPVVRHRWDVVPSREGDQIPMDMEFGAHEETDYLHLDPALVDEVPRLIVQVIVMSKGEPIRAKALREALDAVDMRFGEMQIYHRENDLGQALFSLASVVEPGSFPEDHSADFSTPGVVLFTQLPGVQDGLSIYSDMLFTAERLAALLNAELYDESRSILSRQTIEHTREQILAHRNKVRMARRKH